MAVALVALLDGCTAPVARPTPPTTGTADPGDIQVASRHRVAERIEAVLAEQAAALLRGDERGFLAAAEPGSPAVEVLRRQFRSLRALRVSAWKPRLAEPPAAAAGGLNASLRIDHCFVVPDCQPAPSLLDTRWAVDGGLRIVAVQATPAENGGPRPWEVSALVAAVGPRAVVATTAAQRGQLTWLLREAEKAAAVADRYAVDGRPPDRYLVFYAGEAEWKRWHGGDRAGWMAGYTTQVGWGPRDVVVRAKDLDPTTLRHEMTHASSLPDERESAPGGWWLVEGIAEYAALAGRPLSEYGELRAVRELVAGGWKGPLPAQAPDDKATPKQVGGAYGLGYLAVRHLVDRYGEAKALAFFKAVVHEGMGVDVAAVELLDEPWETVEGYCVAYVRSAAR